MPRTSPSSSRSTSDVDVVQAREVVAQRLGLLAAELEQQGAAASQEARAVGRDAPQESGPVLAPVVGERRLEGQGVALQEPQIAGGHVGDDADDHVDAPFQRLRHRREEIAAVGVHAVAPGAGHGALVDVGRHHASARAPRHEGSRDRAGPGADVDRRPVRRQALHRAQRQSLGLPAGDVDPGLDGDLEAAEADAAGDPGQRLAGEAACDERVQQLSVTRRAGQQLGGLLGGGDEPGVGQQLGQGRGIARRGHG